MDIWPKHVKRIAPKGFVARRCLVPRRCLLLFAPLLLLCARPLLAADDVLGGEAPTETSVLLETKDPDGRIIAIDVARADGA